MSRAEISKALTETPAFHLVAMSTKTGVSLSTLYHMRNPEWDPRMSTVEVVSAYLRKLAGVVND